MSNAARTVARRPAARPALSTRGPETPPPREIYVYDSPRKPALDDEGAQLADDKGQPLWTEETAIPGVESIGIVMLTPKEEKEAMRRAGDDQSAMIFEIIKSSLAEFNGVTVHMHDGTREKALTDMGPRGRRLLMEAINDLGAVDDDVVSDFLASRRVKV
jgi:hypothetical protein